MPRINKVIELLEQGQIPFYHGVKELSYEEGVRMAMTWADYVQVDMEHGPIDMLGLRAFMQGLVAGGPTPSGHRTPTVSVLLPTNGTSEHEVRANAWQIKQALAAGVQSILLCHAESPDAARAFVESARFPFHTLGVGEGLGVGRRGGRRPGLGGGHMGAVGAGVYEEGRRLAPEPRRGDMAGGST